MTELARLGLYVDSSGVVRATKDLQKMERQGTKTEKTSVKATRAIEKGLGKMGRAAGIAAGAFAGFAAVSGSRKLVQVAREFDVINASLETVTGSAENADRAFSQIREFAATTPFDLQQVANAFVKLKALGLDPSEEALNSYGNTAAAMGKDLNQMVEAIADATTGEFERLKEFGIKASSEGDRVRFTFQGMTTEVGKNAAEIEGYLRGIGDVNFSGAMERRADSLDGALSNLGDSWDGLFLTIARAGVGDAIEDAVRVATEAINDLSEAIETFTDSNALVDWAEEASEEALFVAKATGTLVAVYKDLAAARNLAFSFAFNSATLDFDGIGKAFDDYKAKIEENKKEYDDFIANLNGQRTEALNLGGGTTQENKKLVPEIDKDALKAIEKAKDSLKALNLELIYQQEQLGMTDAEIIEYRLSTGDLADEVELLGDSGKKLATTIIRNAKAFDEAKASADAYADAQEAAKDLIESLKTPYDEYIDQLQLIRDLHRQGLLTSEQVSAAQIQAMERLKDATKDNTDKMTVFMEEFAKNTQNLLADNLFDFMQGEFELTADSFKNMLDRMVAEALAADLASKMFGPDGKGGGFLDKALSYGSSLFSSGPSGSELSAMNASMPSSIPSFDGGGYTGSGSRSGGLDGKGGMLAMIHPKETVVDHTKGQSSGNITISPTYNITSNDPQAVRQTIDQSHKQLARQLQHAQRNM